MKMKMKMKKVGLGGPGGALPEARKGLASSGKQSESGIEGSETTATGQSQSENSNR